MAGAPVSFMVDGIHFVERNRTKLINGVRMVVPIADELLDKGVIQQECYDDIKETKTPQEQMRKLYDNVVAKGQKAKEIFYRILQMKEPLLVSDGPSHVDGAPVQPGAAAPQVSMSATTGGRIVAPQISGSNFQGPVNMNFS
ncbi:hypothetical protein MATL_G00219560 [Megalops atlanticus]|uniref:CARD domain-containing protein n=1 Tax=Megalops atlanticus TaxID=7932 RepID=A0A9D3PHB1_MEGAT|nr:hypothetical protein MATL_G00219560 [Megalops atlanticus]